MLHGVKDINPKQPVSTHKMTEKEYQETFGNKRESCHRLKLPGKDKMKMKILIDSIEKVKKFSKLAQNFIHDIDVKTERHIVDGKSIMGLFSLNLSKPVEITIHSDEIEMAQMLFSEFEVK